MTAETGSGAGGWQTVGKTSILRWKLSGMECLQVCLQSIRRSYRTSDTHCDGSCGADDGSGTDQFTPRGRQEHCSESVVLVGSKSCLEAPLQLMMNIGQNGLEAWRLLVRVTGANRIAAMQAILQYKFSPGFDRLEEELRTFEGLVKTYRAIFGEKISDSNHRQSSSRKCLLRSDLIWSCTRSREPPRSQVSCQDLSKMRTASTGSSAVSNGPVPMEIGWVNKKGKGKGKGKDKGNREGKEKGKGKKQSEKQGEKFERVVQQLAESGVTSMPTVGMEKKKQVHQVQSAAASVSLK